MGNYGGQSMVKGLVRVLVRRPNEAFAVEQPGEWNYISRPDLAVAQREHDGLVDLLRRAGAGVEYHAASLPREADSVFVFDPSLITDEGAILLRMGKRLRRAEEVAMGCELARLGIPIRGSLSGEARAEGGDLLWLDEETLVVGIGFRSNAEGATQLESLLSVSGISVLRVDLPYHTGPRACLHLLSLISFVDTRKAVVYLPLLPVRLWQELKKRGFNLIEVAEEEFPTMASNVLALRPGLCIMIEGNPVTQSRIEQSGCQVWTYKGSEISLKAEGGPTCLTLPLMRGESSD